MDWDNVLVAVGSALVVLVGTSAAGGKRIIEIFFNRLSIRLEEKRRLYSDRLKNTTKFQQLFESILTTHPKTVSTISLIKGSNCGGLPRPGVPYRVITVASLGDSQDEVSVYFTTPVQIDTHYTSLLERLVTSDAPLILKSSELPDSLLRKILDIDAITYVVMWFIGISDNELLYLQLDTRLPEGVATLELAEISVKHIQIMRTLFTEFNN